MIRITGKIVVNNKTTGYRAENNGKIADLSMYDALSLVRTRETNAVIVGGKFLRLKTGKLREIRGNKADIHRNRDKSIIDVSSAVIIMTDTSSKGNQGKWYRKRYWIKQDFLGCEGLAEEIASELLKCTINMKFVEYTTCLIRKDNEKTD